MRQGEIFFKGAKAGLLSQYDNGQFEFVYDERWINNSTSQVRQKAYI